MAKETMTVYKALEVKKMLTQRLEKVKNRNYRLVAVINTMDKKEVSTGMSVDEIDKKFIASLDSTAAIDYNLEAIENAIAASNARTIVTIANEEFTIDAAIRRDRKLEDRARRWRGILDDVLEADGEVKKNIERKLSQEMIDRHISSILGDSKKDDTLIENLRENYIKNNTIEVYDPYNMREKAVAELEKIEEFKNELHTALTISNCNTMIEVEYYDGPKKKEK